MEPFARNVVHFVRLLHGAGLGMSPAHAVDALDARASAANDFGKHDEQAESLHARMSFSAQERLSHRDFDTLSADE